MTNISFFHPRRNPVLPGRILILLPSRLSIRLEYPVRIRDTALTPGTGFVKEIIKTGVRLIYHQSPINANTDWVQSTVKLILRPGNCHGSQLRQPTLVWAVLPVVSRMKASGTFDASLFEAEKMWSTLSLLDVHSIMGDEASSFFSITAANGVVHLFEAPSGEARDYVVKGLRLVVSRLTYHMIVGDSKIIYELFSEDGAESTGDLPSLTKPSNALSKIVHSLLDQQ